MQLNINFLEFVELTPIASLAELGNEHFDRVGYSNSTIDVKHSANKSRWPVITTAQGKYQIAGQKLLYNCTLWLMSRKST